MRAPFTVFAFFLLALLVISPDSKAQTSPGVYKQPRVMKPGLNKTPKFHAATQRLNFHVDPEQLKDMLEPELTTACSLGYFNQIRRNKQYVNLEYPDKSVRRFGIISKDPSNLRDVYDLAGGGNAYLFEMDGTSECRVYSVPTPKR